MVLLAHIRDQRRLNLGSYGRPRMTEELNELGLQVGQRRVGRVRQENDPPDRFQNLSLCARTAFKLFGPASSRGSVATFLAGLRRPSFGHNYAARSANC